MPIDVLEPSALAAADLAAWRALQASRPALASPFLSPDWVLALAEADGPDARAAKVAVVRGAAREPLGFLQARVGRFSARPVGAPLCDYQALVGDVDLRIPPAALLTALGVGRLDFDHALTDTPLFAEGARGRETSLIVDLSAGHDAYAQGRAAAGTDVLKDCAKKRRKLEREYGAVRFTALSDDAGDFDRLIAWKRAQYARTGQTDVLAAGWPLRLLDGLWRRREPGFRAALFTLHAGETLVAAHLALCNARVLHAWFIAHDEAYARYSPGVVLIADILRWAAEAGVREVDFGPGDYPFKQRLANASREVGHGFLGRLSAASLARGAAYGVRGAAEALPLGRASALPGKAMRRMDLIASLR